MVFTRLGITGPLAAGPGFAPKRWERRVTAGDMHARVGELGALHIGNNPTCSSGGNWMTYGAIVWESLRRLTGIAGARDQQSRGYRGGVVSINPAASAA